MSDRSPLLSIEERTSTAQEPFPHKYPYLLSDKLAALATLLVGVSASIATATSNSMHYCDKGDPLSLENLRKYSYALLSVTFAAGAHNIRSAFSEKHISCYAPMAHCILGSLCIAIGASLIFFESFSSQNCKDFKGESKATSDLLTYATAGTAILSGIGPIIAKLIYNNTHKNGHGILTRADSFLEP